MEDKEKIVSVFGCLLAGVLLAFLFSTAYSPLYPENYEADPCGFMLAGRALLRGLEYYGSHIGRGLSPFVLGQGIGQIAGGSKTGLFILECLGLFLAVLMIVLFFGCARITNGKRRVMSALTVMALAGLYRGGGRMSDHFILLILAMVYPACRLWAIMRGSAARGGGSERLHPGYVITISDSALILILILNLLTCSLADLIPGVILICCMAMFRILAERIQRYEEMERPADGAEASKKSLLALIIVTVVLTGCFVSVFMGVFDRDLAVMTNGRAGEKYDRLKVLCPEETDDIMGMAMTAEFFIVNDIFPANRYYEEINEEVIGDISSGKHRYVICSLNVRDEDGRWRKELLGNYNVVRAGMSFQLLERKPGKEVRAQ